MDLKTNLAGQSQHICNTYEWCREGVSSGIEQLPYLSKKIYFPGMKN